MMGKKRTPQLLEQLGWLIRLRWGAGAAVLCGGLANELWFDWYPVGGRIALLGLSILAYNLPLWALRLKLRQGTPRRPALLALAWAQILLDMVSLTAVVLCTGGLKSPIASFFVFHMVVASLLLSRAMAYGAAAAAMGMLSVGLLGAGQWPTTLEQRLAGMGWVVTLLLIVHVSNHITRSLAQQRRRLVRQNRQIRGMSKRLKQQQQAMIQNEKMAAMGQMAAGVAHEIANPLASMDSLLQLIQRNPDRQGPETADTLRQQVQRIHGIVQQMTEFAHPADSPWQEVDANELVEQALHLVQYDQRLRRVEIVRDLAGDAGAVRAQPRGVQQVLVNLIINALDAMVETPEPRLTLSTAGDGQWCLLRVGDNGHGIDPAHLDRLFEPFFTTKAVGKGTGLGLSVSYSLVNQQGGTILVASTPGQGAVFTVRLPRAEGGKSPEITQSK